MTPAGGKWIEPRWVRTGAVIGGENSSKTKDLCDPSCSRRTSTWSATVIRTAPPGSTNTFEYYATTRVALPSGDVKTIKASLSG